MMCVDLEVGSRLLKEFEDIVRKEKSIQFIEHKESQIGATVDAKKPGSSKKAPVLPTMNALPENVIAAKITTEQALELTTREPINAEIGLFGTGNRAEINI